MAAQADNSGNKIGTTFSYDPFGQSLNGQQPDDESGNMDFGWLGDKERQTEHEGTLDTIEMGQREYVPGLGRFLQTDPVPGGSANDYDYCSAEPISCFDLAGTWPHIHVSWKTIAIVVAVVVVVAIVAIVAPEVFAFAAAAAEDSSAEEGVYAFRATSGRTYVGQSGRISQRLAEHVRAGRVSEKEASKASRIAVKGGQLQRRIREQREINVRGGIRHLDNKINSIARRNWSRHGIR